MATKFKNGIDADSNRIQNVATPTASNDAVSASTTLSTTAISASNKIVDASGTNTVSGTALSSTNKIVDQTAPSVAQVGTWPSNFWWANHRVQGQSATQGTAPTEATELAVPIAFPFQVTINAISVGVGTTAASAGGVVRLGIRNSTGSASQQAPGTVLIDGGTVPTTSISTYVKVDATNNPTNWASNPVLQPYTLYWLCAIPQGTPTTRAQFIYSNATHLSMGAYSATVPTIGTIPVGYIANATTPASPGTMTASFSLNVLSSTAATQFPAFILRRA